MKPFNLEQAKAGKPVCTRDGRPARIICYDRLNTPNAYFRYPIVALITTSNLEHPIIYTEKGESQEGKHQDCDLFMASTKHEGWINIYNAGGEDVESCRKVFKSFEDAKNASHNKDYIATVKIEWED